MLSSQASQIIIIAGPNGAGKSTLAPYLLRDWLGLLEYGNADTIAQGLSAFRPEEAAFKAGRVMLSRLRELAAKGENFAFETTLATRSYAPWLRELCQQGYRSSWIVYDNSSLSRPLKLATGEQAVENVIEPALWEQFCEVAK